MIKQIIFDFDGVIIDSVPRKTLAFKQVLQRFSDAQINLFLRYHEENGGVSRFEKFRYFYEKILNQSYSEIEIQELSKQFSLIVKNELSNPKYLITETIAFIKNNYQKYAMHIASGTENSELKFLCDHLGLTIYFKSISGSPEIKSHIVKNIITRNAYKKSEVVLIGDSMTDLDAAKSNNILFMGYNNCSIKAKCSYYIDSFDCLDLKRFCNCSTCVK